MLTESHVSDRFLGLSSLLQRIRAGTVHAMLLAKPLDANYLEGKIIPMPLGRERCHYLDSSVKNIRSAFVAVQPEHIATKLFVGYWMVCAPWGLQSWRLGPSLLPLPWLPQQTRCVSAKLHKLDRRPHLHASSACFSGLLEQNGFFVTSREC